MIRDLVYSLALGLLHGIAYVALALFGGVFLMRPEIDELLEVLP
jgi:hypothetical protein